MSHHSFADRHISLTDDDRAKMLAGLGYGSASDLLGDAVPDDIQIDGPLGVPSALSETEAIAALRAYADQNQVFTSLIGQGWNDTITPAVIRRNMIENPAWYTAYTPYQPEISQGRLEMLLVFQTMIADLTGCELANASLLDESTASAEAMTMLRRLDRTKRNGFFVDQDCHPQTIAVCLTRAEPLGIDVTIGDPATDLVPDEVYGALLAQPGSSGAISDLGPIIRSLHDAQATAAVTTDLFYCTLGTPPGEAGADVVVGSAQRFGVPMGFGGPHAGFMATKEKHARSLPGRLVGVSIDSHGHPAYRLALQTREQHIRRDKATSNICTAQALLANVAASYACWHGPDGLTAIAERINGLTSTFRSSMAAAGHECSETFFDTVTIAGDADTMVAAAAAKGINITEVQRHPHLGELRRDHHWPDRAQPARRIWSRLPVGRRFGNTDVAVAKLFVPHRRQVPPFSERTRDAALAATACRPRSGSRPHDDPVGVVHHEAECSRRDGAHHLARVRRHSSVRSR